MVPIYENYKDYKPPRYAKPAITRLLANLPKQYVSGLESVVLTNAAVIGRGKTHRLSGKKYLRNRCRGWYHPKTNDGQAWIEIVVDNVVATSLLQRGPRVLSRIPLMQDIALSQTLFHEIGHHLDSTMSSLGRGREASADAWIPRLIRCYFRKRYWYLIPFLRPAKAIIDAVIEHRRGRATRNA
jgi:hypothetical protein